MSPKSHPAFRKRGTMSNKEIIDQIAALRRKEAEAEQTEADKEAQERTDRWIKDLDR